MRRLLSLILPAGGPTPLAFLFAVLSAVLLSVALAPAAVAQESGEEAGEGPLVLANATLVDGTGAEPRPHVTVVVEGGRIARVVDGALEDPPAGARVVDLAGRFLLPGLIDAHVHISNLEDPEATLEGLLDTGVTTVREMGGDARTLAVLARDAKVGAIRSPDIYYSAVFFGPPWLQDRRAGASARGLEPGAAPWSRVVTADSDLRQVVAEAKGTGATGLKLYSALEPDLVREIVEEAHRQGLKVWSHSTIYPSKPSDAVAAGVDVISHGGGLYPESRPDVPSSYTEGIGRWMPRQDFAAVDPSEPPYDELFARMERNGTLLEPTVSVFPRRPAKGKSAAPGGQRSEAARRVDVFALREWSCAATRAAHRAGVEMVAGTDMTHRRRTSIGVEMEALVECGLKPLEAIRAATLNGARAIGREESLGTVEVGKAADLVVLSADPLEDIANVGSVFAVVKAGRLSHPGDPAPGSADPR